MRKCLLCTAAIAAGLTSPALATDRSGYFAVDGGVLLPQQTHVDGKVTDSTGATVIQAGDIFGIKYKSGYDLDVTAGYDLGMFRIEGELGYKRAGLDRLAVSQSVLDEISNAADVAITPDDLRLDGHARVFSGMVNGLLDVGSPQLSAFAGAGIGLAGVKFSGGGLSASDSSVAWQILAGVRTAISPELEFGLKYRYFRTGKLKFSDTVDVDGDLYKGTLSGHFSSHSLLASFTYNLGAPAVASHAPSQPFAPQQPPPATQTCPDGSVVLATNFCGSAMPPQSYPAPRPYPSPERGAVLNAPNYGQVTIVPANTSSGRCIQAPDNYVGTGAANMPAVTTAMPLCSTVSHP